SRDRFTLSPVPTGDACVVCGTPQPLTPEELRSLSRAAGTAARAGYRVPVTVKEREGSARLDIGPFHRPIVWKTNVFKGHEVRTHVNGTVLGEVWLADPEGKPFVDTGTVIPTEPEPVTFTLESHDPQIRLTVDENRTLNFFNAELLDGPE